MRLFLLDGRFSKISERYECGELKNIWGNEFDVWCYPLYMPEDEYRIKKKVSGEPRPIFVFHKDNYIETGIKCPYLYVSSDNDIIEIVDKMNQLHYKKMLTFYYDTNPRYLEKILTPGEPLWQ